VKAFLNRGFWSTLILGVFGSITALASDIASTKHNLSTSGSGSVIALNESRICVFCHTPHNANPAAQLWNRNEPGATYTPYSSSSMEATPGQPTGSSKLCLSCHDGTIALGEVLSESAPIQMHGGVTTMPPGRSRLGLILRDDHPISFAYTSALAVADGQLADPNALTGEVQLDANGELQCTSCHDAHDDTFGHFLVMDNRTSALCQSCHERDFWEGSTHRTSTAGWNQMPPDPWPHTDETTVSDNACENCHNPHEAGGAERLLNEEVEEQNCFPCHNGNVAQTDIEDLFDKMFIHPIRRSVGVHDPEETPPITTPHVECVDCHNPHAVDGSAGTPPLVSGPLRGVSGIDTDGDVVDPAATEYEICYKCHADSPGQLGPWTPRAVVQHNTRLEFDAANPSFHPVEAAGVNSDVPSLLPPYTIGSVIYCTDCHNTDNGPRSGGTDPDGPHGSTHAPLLGWRFETGDNIEESPSAYELCYRCHDRSSILNDESFGAHEMHIRGERASCSTCHDPHGISHTQGNATNHSHLINFDISIVGRESGSLRREFIDRGRFQGECWLRCHSKNHDPEEYPD
jgi:predicted CXXCH cytochrome family protein